MGFSLWQHLCQLFSKSAQHINTPWCEHRYVVVDLELTGLNPKEHEIVSIAWVVIENQRIKTQQSQHLLHRDVNALAQSPIFHGITSEQLQSQGHSMDTILARFIQATQESVLVFHNSLLDMRFLACAAKAHDVVLPPHQLDTLKIEQRRLSRQGTEIALDALSLEACRARYSLPAHSAHNALSDALATAELFLAQANQVSRRESVNLSQLLSAR